jgi:hypothetical protein
MVPNRRARCARSNGVRQDRRCVFYQVICPTAGLHIKAVGIVTDADFRKITDDMGWGVSVRWVPMPEGRIAVGPVEDHSDYLRRGTLYEEYNPSVIKRVLDVLVPTKMDRLMAILPRPEKTDKAPVIERRF